MNKEYHVAVSGYDHADGSAAHPFRTISKAAAVAMAGDTVIVHEGEYREWVKPANSGTSEISRIVYRAADGEKVAIKGSDGLRTGCRQKGRCGKPYYPIVCSGIIILIKRPWEGTGLYILKIIPFIRVMST